MKKLFLAALISSVATTAIAEEYQFFGDVGYTDSDVAGSEAVIDLSGTYYFAGQKSIGPLDQFGYLDDTTNLRADTSTTDGDTDASIGGTYYFGKFAVGVDYEDEDENSTTSVHGNYFIQPNLKAGLAFAMPDEGDDVITASLKYDHKLNDTDYIGVTVEISDDEASKKTLSSKYFNTLDNGAFLVVEAGLLDDDANSVWSASGKYYINKFTGFGIGSIDGDYNYIEASHFINTNIAFNASIGEMDDATAYRLGAKFQF